MFVCLSVVKDESTDPQEKCLHISDCVYYCAIFWFVIFCAMVPVYICKYCKWLFRALIHFLSTFLVTLYIRAARLSSFFADRGMGDPYPPEPHHRNDLYCVESDIKPLVSHFVHSNQVTHVQLNDRSLCDKKTRQEWYVCAYCVCFMCLQYFVAVGWTQVQVQCL